MDSRNRRTDVLRVHERRGVLSDLRSHFATNLKSWLLGGTAVVGWLSLIFIIDRITALLIEGEESRFWLNFWIFIAVTVTLVFIAAITFGYQKWVEMAARINLRYRDPREDQRKAFEALREVDGYSIKRYRRTITIHGGPHLRDDYKGAATSSYEIVLSCGSRGLEEWSRMTTSDLVMPADSKNVVMNLMGHTAKLKRMSLKDMVLVEKVVFDPPIGRSREIPMELTRESPSGTFKIAPTEKGDSPDEAEDYLSFTPHEPTEEIDHTVVFEGMKIDEVWATATVGPAAIPLRREENELADRLQRTYDGGHLTVRLQIPHPVMGVKYKIHWTIEASDSN